MKSSKAVVGCVWDLNVNSINFFTLQNYHMGNLSKCTWYHPLIYRKENMT